MRRAFTASISKPIHNVKERKKPSSPSLADLTIGSEVFIPREAGGASRDRTDDLKLAKLALSQLSYGPKRPACQHGTTDAIQTGKPVARGKAAPLRTCAMVGRGGVEPPTSRLSGVRSNHLSYRPMLARPACQTGTTDDAPRFSAAAGPAQVHQPTDRTNVRPAGRLSLG
jgi:hypothetical protein